MGHAARRAMLGLEEELPSGLLLAKYIERTTCGSTYPAISTDEYPTVGQTIDAEIAYISKSGDSSCVIGTGQDTSHVWIGLDSTFIRVEVRGTDSSSTWNQLDIYPTTSMTELHKLHFEYTDAYHFSASVDGGEMQTMTSSYSMSFSTNITYGLSGRHLNSTQPFAYGGAHRIKSFKVTNSNGVVTTDMIAVYDTATSRYCMYDRIRKKCYYAAGGTYYGALA